MARAIRNARASPSTANGTSFSEGREPRTKVIMGCTDATAAPASRNRSSSAAASAPLECSATRPFQSAAAARDSAAPAIALSGTQNQTTPARIRARVAAATEAPTSRANHRARCKEGPGPRAMICSMVYPASRSDAASALARFPAPTIATGGFTGFFGTPAG